MALCEYDREQRVLRYAGARLPLLYSTNAGFEIIEPAPAAIGTERVEEVTLINVEISMAPGMRLYLMSDGPYSQLSGEASQAQAKFGRRRLYEILEKTAHLSPQEQLEQVQRAIREWQGTTPQTDDMTLWILQLAES